MVMLALTAFIPGLTPDPDKYPTVAQVGCQCTWVQAWWLVHEAGE